jgi:hypothetical protein
MPPSTNGLLYEYFKYLTLGGTIGAPYTGVQANSSPNVALLVRPAIGKNQCWRRLSVCEVTEVLCGVYDDESRG